MAPTKSQNKGLDGGSAVKSDLRTAVVRFDLRSDVRLNKKLELPARIDLVVPVFFF